MNYTPVSSRPGGLRLHLNENTAGCSPAVLAALRAIERTDASEYPDYSQVTAQCEAFFGVSPGFVQITNGLDEGLHVVAQAAKMSLPDFEAIVVEPAFEMYAACIAAVDGRQVTVPASPDLEFPLSAVLDAISPRTRLIYLCDPNNPSGLPIPAGEIQRIADAAPDALVLVDEAYADFSGRTMVGPMLERNRNVVVGRTFAKAHGLAALRVGALIAHPRALEPLRRVLPPYSINICAVVALQAAMADRAYVDWYVSEAAQSRDLIYAWCRSNEIPFWPSEGNFVLLRVGPEGVSNAAKACVAALTAKGIYIRDKSNTPGCDGCIRITAGVVEDTRVCLAAMEEWYATRGN
jgi:histidinol-phosphate aminotransferase